MGTVVLYCLAIVGLIAIVRKIREIIKFNLGKPRTMCQDVSIKYQKALAAHEECRKAFVDYIEAKCSLHWAYCTGLRQEAVDAVLVLHSLLWNTVINTNHACFDHFPVDEFQYNAKIGSVRKAVCWAHKDKEDSYLPKLFPY